MSRQMATMIGSGLSLLRTLNILAEQTENKKLAKILGDVRDDVETGVSLSDAMRKHADDLPAAHDQHGPRRRDRRLPRQRARVDRRRTSRRRSSSAATIKSAMTYPVDRAHHVARRRRRRCCIFIVPVFEKMFEGLGGTLPAADPDPRRCSRTRWSGSRRCCSSSASSFAIWWRQEQEHRARCASVVDPLKLKLPVFGAADQEDRRRPLRPQLLEHDRRRRAHPAGAHASSGRPRATG